MSDANEAQTPVKPNFNATQVASIWLFPLVIISAFGFPLILLLLVPLGISRSLLGLK